MTSREVQTWPADPWAVLPDLDWDHVRQQIETLQAQAKWYKNRPKAKPVRQQPSQEYKDNGFRTETELAEREIVEYLEMGIGISNLSVAS